MIAETEFGALQLLVAIGMVAVFIMMGLVREQKRDAKKNDEGGEEDV